MSLGASIASAFSGVPESFAQQIGISVAVCALLHVARAIIDPMMKQLAWRLGAPSEMKANKFAHQGLNLAFHIVSTWYLYDVIYFQEQWLDYPERIWEGWSLEFAGFNPVQYYVFFCFEFGYHLQRLVHVLVHRQRDDFWEMLIHHFLTVFLISSVLVFRYHRIGMLVLFAHDSSDILGCFVKMINALGYKIASVLVFIPMCATWFYTRLYLMPRYILASALDSPECSVKWPCVASLVILIMLNAYWFYLFLWMLWIAVSSGGKRVEDVQEDGKLSRQSEELAKKGNKGKGH